MNSRKMGAYLLFILCMAAWVAAGMSWEANSSLRERVREAERSRDAALAENAALERELLSAKGGSRTPEKPRAPRRRRPTRTPAPGR